MKKSINIALFILATFTFVMWVANNYSASYAPALFQTWAMFSVIFYFSYINRY